MRARNNFKLGFASVVASCKLVRESLFLTANHNVCPLVCRGMIGSFDGRRKVFDDWGKCEDKITALRKALHTYKNVR
jgi:hypothetical protein